MIIYQAEDQGCAYSIDSEGTLFYTPMYQDGTINLEDWCEVDLMNLMGEEDNLRTTVDDIHRKLIKMSMSIGEYFKNQ